MLIGMNTKPKILICVVSFNARNHIVEVLNRIPEEFLYSKAYDVDVIVLDDASSDNTYEIAKDYAKIAPEKITVKKNVKNQGYGGNQKVAYTYAIKNGYDVAVLLHGDAQYAPELLPEIVAPLVNDNYDVVLGSRMVNKKDALKGRMPKYKFIGNIALTTFQNIVLGANLSEYHTGYRAYSTRALKKVPFEINSDYFEFDTDILIQMIDNKLPIKEIAIPTHYGTEVCNVNVVKYGLLVLKSTLLSRLNRVKLLKTPRFTYDSEQLESARKFYSQKKLRMI